MALILDRQAIDDRAWSGTRRPAITLTADNIPGWERMNHSFLGAEPNEDAARQLMNLVEGPQLSVTIWFNEDPGKRATVLEAAAAWEKLGIQTAVRGLPWETGYLPMLESGNPFDNAYVGSWGYDYPEAINLLELWRCSGFDGGNSAFCDPAYDAVLDMAANEIDEGRRTDFYARAEAMLTGEAGAMPAIPTAWGTIPVAFRGPAAGAVFINAMGQLDLTRVDVDH
jgi:oligopeptide transport system substrate-binding protein